MANEEEYHIPDEEQVQVASSGEAALAASSSDVKPKSGMKKIIIIVIAIAVLWATHRMFSAVREARKLKAAPHNITEFSTPPHPLEEASFAERAPSMPVQPAEQVQTLPLPPQRSVAVNTVPGGGLNTRLATVEESGAEVQAKLERTNANMAELQNMIATMTSQLAAINNTVQDLNTQISQQQAQIRSLMIEGMPVTKKSHHTAVRGEAAESPHRKKVAYYIQALVPGRAWLAASDETVLTVKEGDNIPGYGVVTVIDPTQSVIMTSSGETIAFKNE
ncbi:MAG: hypothetical protein HY939_05125 [Gammaproteobacteria bacterium]|nr:hypothetical protein [Gammaproteobacteria bacterium]